MTAQGLALLEGGRTAGVWGPLAAVSIATMLQGIWRDLRGDRGMRLLEAWEWLRAWALPFMSEAMRREAEDAAARREFEAYKAMAAKFSGGKGEGGKEEAWQTRI